MIRQALNGTWRMETEDGRQLDAALPGSSYAALVDAGLLEDPFYGTREAEAGEVAKQAFTFRRRFTADKDLLAQPVLELVVQGPDTLCTFRLNGRQVGNTNNAYRTWRLDVKPFLQPGENELEIRIENPYPYVEERQAARPLKSSIALKGTGHLRKPPYHFGWDWGPRLPPAGVLGGIWLEGYERRLEDVLVAQRHENGAVTLAVTARLAGSAESARLEAVLAHPDGGVQRAAFSGDMAEILVESPKLWWPSGMGAQPLYRLEVVLDGGIDTWQGEIGLRTVELDTTPDNYGNRFLFKANGVPFFAKGANWIPAEVFRPDDPQRLRELVAGAAQVGMNMLRVWGGGFYESDVFYSLCDEYGILVWQDFMFCCGAYPLYDPEFVENVRQEVVDNIRRLRHHPSLALWCGNNENELFALLWRRDEEVRESNAEFYHTMLPGWVAALDPGRVYWPGSPSSGSRRYKPHDMGRGDAHLWQMWHGLAMPAQLCKYPARFSSEYGIESLPSMRTVRQFTNDPAPDMLGEEMLAHQKSAGGNHKMIYYLLGYYRLAESLPHMAYLTQLVQARIVGEAVDMWRRNLKRHGGSLYWQLNDCWPVASWSSVEYGGDYKALQYAARHFHKRLSLSPQVGKNWLRVYVVNEPLEAFAGTLRWRALAFDGTFINEGEATVEAEGYSAAEAAVLEYTDVLKGRDKRGAVLVLELRQGEKMLDRRICLPVPDRDALLPNPTLQLREKRENGQLTVTATSEVFARSVMLDAPDVAGPWSDNFFDLLPGESITVTAPLCAGAVPGAVSALTVADIPPAKSLKEEKRIRRAIAWSKTSIVSKILFKFIV